MRQLIMWNLMTLDGLFEGTTPWSLDWHQEAWGPELQRLSVEQLRGADTVLFGRATYEGMAAHWPTAKGEVAELMNEIPKVVFSNTLADARWRNARLVAGRAEEEVRRMKAQPGRDMLLFGSAALAASLMREGLIDEYRIGLAPVVLGGGTPLFKPSPTSTRMQLADARPLPSGCVVLTYRPGSRMTGAP